MKTIISIIGLTLLLACGSSTAVQRTSANQNTDLSGYWNDTDSRFVAEEMIQNIVAHPWLSNFVSNNKKNPIIVAGKISNKTSEHINTNTFVKDIEKELLKSGRVYFIASQDERKNLRKEKIDQQANASMESAKELGNELAADYILQGEISSITDQVEGEKVVYYQVNLELVDIEKNLKVWTNDKKIKKLVSRAGVKLKP